MVGHYQMRFFADAKPCRADIHPALGQHVQFGQKAGHVQHNAIADQAGLALVQDTGRDKVQDGLLTLNLEGVAGVVAALEAHDDLTCGTEHINDLALAFVAPLRPDDDRVRHNLFASGRPVRGGNTWPHDSGRKNFSNPAGRGRQIMLFRVSP